MAFIAFEGLDGAGKSTLIQGLADELARQLISCRVTREPGGTQLGEEIRQILLRSKGEAPLPRTELLLYQAGRAQHVDFVIRPALKNKEWVLCDRFSASSTAFQSGGRGLKLTQIDWLNEFATDGLKPDLYVLLDLSVEQSQKRREHREADRLEKEAHDFHERVRQAYLTLAKNNPEGWLVIDASIPAKQSLQLVLTELKKRQWLA